MRCMPRISLAMNQISNDDPELELYIKNQKPKSVFRAARREFQTTTFISDQHLAMQREKDLMAEEIRKQKESEPPPPPPKFHRITYIPPPPEIECKPSKKVSKTEVGNIVDRLTQTKSKESPPRSFSKNSPISPRNSVKSHKNKNKNKNSPEPDAVFERLYSESTQLYVRRSQSKEYQNIYYSPSKEDDTENLNKSFVEKKMENMLDEAFGEKKALTLNELLEVFIKLGIIEASEKIENIPQISRVIEKWKLGTNFYNSEKIKNILYQALLGKKGRFKHFARERMSFVLANHRNNENCSPSNEQNQNIHTAKRMTQETFDRLLTPRPDFTPQIPPEEEEIVYEPFELSQGTKKILKNSQLGKAKLEVRDQQLCDRAMKRLNELREQMETERKNMLKRPKVVLPEISSEEREKIEELKQKRQSALEEKPPYRPDIMKYSDFQVVKESMKEEKEKPPGIDQFLNRIKKGYDQHMKKKYEEENIRALPELSDKKRAKSETRKKKEPKPPPPPPPEPVVVEVPVKGKKGTAKNQNRPSTQIAKTKPPAAVEKTAKTVKGPQKKETGPFKPK